MLVGRKITHILIIKSFTYAKMKHLEIEKNQVCLIDLWDIKAFRGETIITSIKPFKINSWQYHMMVVRVEILELIVKVMVTDLVKEIPSK